MQRQRRRDTAPETRVRKGLFACGYRFRVDYRLPGTRRRGDIVFPGRKIAIFIDGCFWHSCPEHGTVPKKNRDWWIEKLEGNQKRDRETDQLLEEQGWTCFRFWEHEDPQEIVRTLAKRIGPTRAALESDLGTTRSTDG